MRKTGKLRGAGKYVPSLTRKASPPKSSVRRNKSKTVKVKLPSTLRTLKVTPRKSEQQAENTLAIIKLYYSILPAMAYIKHTINSMKGNVNANVISSYRQALGDLKAFSRELSSYIDRMDPTRSVFVVPSAKTVEGFRNRLQEYYDIFFITDAEINEGRRLLLDDASAQAEAIKQIKKDDMMDMLVGQMRTVHMNNGSAAARPDPEVDALTALMMKL